LHAVDVDDDLHSAASTRLDPREHVEGDGGIVPGWWCVTIVGFIDHFDGEQLLAHLFVAVSEGFITTEATTILAALGNL
jgi:hypothetical protein